MAYEPTDIAQQALDAAGVDYTLGGVEDGTREAQVVLRAYQECLKQLLRGAHWDFARKTTPLVLLADATGQTPNVGTMVPQPWIYEYAYPNDCMKVRFIPQNWMASNPAVPVGNITPPDPTAPVVTNLSQPPYAGGRVVPARFVIATDYNNMPPSPVPYDQIGVSPEGRTVILTNVQYAQCVYTAQMNYPSVWDPNFRAAFVSYLASEIALPLSKDKKFGLQMQSRLIELTKEKVREARARDGNEGFYSSDIAVDWMRLRAAGGSTWGPWGPGGGGWAGGWNGGFGGWDNVGFSNGSAY